MARAPAPTTVRVEPVDGDGPRRDQIERIVYGFEWYLRGRHGRRVARQFRKGINAVLTGPATYQQVIQALEVWLNRYLDSVHQDLQELVN